MWAALSVLAAFYAAWLGYGGRGPAATLCTFAFFLAVQLFLAARGIRESLLERLGAGGGYFLGLTALLAYLIYSVGTNSFLWWRAALATAFVLVPLGVASSAQDSPAGAWQDYFNVAAIWAALKFYFSHRLWPYPGGKLGYVLTIELALAVGLAVFLLIRRLDGVGYALAWGKRWGFVVLFSFLLFIAIAVPAGRAIGFLRWEPQLAQWKTLPFSALGIFLFTAWPEEFLFRGLLQNLLSRSLRSPAAGLLLGSVFFGLAHITNYGFPNWRYVLLATMAGVFYGWTWKKTESIFASALVHTMVNVCWHFLFRTQ